MCVLCFCAFLCLHQQNNKESGEREHTTGNFFCFCRGGPCVVQLLVFTDLFVQTHWAEQAEMTYIDRSLSQRVFIARRLGSNEYFLSFGHSRPQSRLALLTAEGWARGPRGSGDTGFRKS